ncbi:alkaline phosphatase PhoX [Xanthomonas fragariae]|uniref:alkaline phosphatase PhoX n=1 Tax=Xanthomonas fragariae TaxID=48664 RepID=UPI00265D2B42|nr:alkaline phosphatase PhoX [Xanthomonas fragariae]
MGAGSVTQRLSVLFVNGNQLAAHNPDNVAINARGDVALQEDGGESPNEYGPGARLLGLTRSGESFYLAKNHMQLTLQQIADTGKTITEGD